jgi:hypothetical protein
MGAPSRPRVRNPRACDFDVLGVDFHTDRVDLFERARD